MSANIHGKMVYSFEKPMWHSITEPSLVPMTAEGILDERFDGGFGLSFRPNLVQLNGELRETGDLAIVRSPSPHDDLGEVIFGYVTERFNILQPRSVAQSFDSNVCEFAETMAFLGDGQEMFISWKMPSFTIGTNDEHETFGIIRGGFDGNHSWRLFTSIFRPVCSNTITLAEGWARRNTNRSTNQGMIWRGKGVNKNLERDLGYWLEHVQGKALAEVSLLQSFFGKLAEVPVRSEYEAQEILFEAFPDKEDVSVGYPAQLREAKHEAIEKENLTIKGVRDGIYRLFAGEGTAITPTYKGMVDATSEYVCHVQPSKKPIAESVMFGGRQKTTMQMINTLKNRVK